MKFKELMNEYDIHIKEYLPDKKEYKQFEKIHDNVNQISKKVWKLYKEQGQITKPLVIFVDENNNKKEYSKFTFKLMDTLNEIDTTFELLTIKLSDLKAHLTA